MHIKQIHVTGFKRFTDLVIQGIGPETRLVVLTGPNGSGKSSLFDAFMVWHQFHGGRHIGWDNVYHRKAGATVLQGVQEDRMISLDFHEELPKEQQDRKRAVYVRSAYRNDPDFTTQQLSRMGSVLDGRRVNKLIETDSIVSENYQRLVSASVAGLYGGEHDAQTVAELREKFIGQVRNSMKRVFDDLLLCGPGDPLSNGTFYFEKGTSKDFHYKNLSGGEKAAFDLILDIIVKRTEYNDTVYVIDEPEAHMHTRLQSRLLEELLNLIPENSQLWIATHSIGMMRKAKELKEAKPSDVVFLDFGRVDFDTKVALEPVEPDRQFWLNSLHIALDDMASLVAPSCIVLCEGQPTEKPASPRSDFDAKCYRTIFAREFPETDFVSAGNSADVESDRLRLAHSFKHLFRSMNIIRVVDRDDKSPQQVADTARQGIRVLSRRHLESYLLDDEIIAQLCISRGKGQLVSQALDAKKAAVNNSIGRGRPPDDVKSAAGETYNQIKSLLSLTACGNDTDAFLRDTMAPLVTPDTQTYADLKKDIFGQ
jgi:hypothetical protein